MKCIECSCAKKGYFSSKPDAYVCTGVKEPFLISDINVKCTEYPEKRNEEIIMNTAEMWVQAQKDGKIYECIDGDMAYSKEYGLTDKFNFDEPWNLKAWSHRGAWGLDDLMDNEWQVMENVMTIDEAEKKFNIIIVKG